MAAVEGLVGDAVHIQHRLEARNVAAAALAELEPGDPLPAAPRCGHPSHGGEPREAVAAGPAVTDAKHAPPGRD